MLSINHTTSASRNLTPNILPCAIKHNGPVTTEPRHWSPAPAPAASNSNETDDSLTAYFRGRKLRGRKVKIPHGYEGVVMAKTERVLAERPAEPAAVEEDEDDDADMGIGEQQEVKIAESRGQFDEIVVWGHEAVPGDEDVYVKGVEEWIGFAEAMHAYEEPVKT